MTADTAQDDPTGPRTALTPDSDALGAADAAYRPIRDPSSWSPVRVDNQAWQSAIASLAERREEASSDALRRAVEVAMRAAAVDSGAIEGLYDVDRGFTMSVALQTTAWQTAMLDKGEDVRTAFEAQLSAYELALDIATNSMPITEAWIRRLHEVVTPPESTVRVLTPLGLQEHALKRGEYKQLPNHVVLTDGTLHAYAPVSETAAEMHRLVQYLTGTELAQAHPVTQAAYAHHALAAIHPFQDGNGRVARALASVYLYRAASIPLVVFKDDKREYFDVLASADSGDPQRFVDFVSTRAIDTLHLVADQIAAEPGPALDRLRQLLRGHGGLLEAELDAVGYDVLATLSSEFTAEIASISLPQGVHLQHWQGQASGTGPAVEPGFRHLESKGRVAITLQGHIDPPIQTHVSTQIEVLVAQGKDAPHAFRIRAQNLNEALDIRLRDVYPERGAALALRLTAWSRLALRRTLDELGSDVEKLNGSRLLAP